MGKEWQCGPKANRNSWTVLNSGDHSDSNFRIEIEIIEFLKALSIFHNRKTVPADIGKK